MSPKWAFLAHFGDISYNVFNRRKSSYFIIKPLDFTISCRMDHFTESNHQKLIFFVYFLKFYKSPSVTFWYYRVYFTVFTCIISHTFTKITILSNPIKSEKHVLLYFELPDERAMCTLQLTASQEECQRKRNSDERECERRISTCHSNV